MSAFDEPLACMWVFTNFLMLCLEDMGLHKSDHMSVSIFFVSFLLFGIRGLKYMHYECLRAGALLLIFKPESTWPLTTTCVAI
jgi:hypothetical protein